MFRNGLNQDAILDGFIFKISGILPEIDDQIEEYLLSETPNESGVFEIEKKFKELKSIVEIDEFQQNEIAYGYFKYVYHAKNASYLRVVGREVEAELQEKLSKRFETFKERGADYFLCKEESPAVDLIDPGVPVVCVSADAEDFETLEFDPEHIEMIFEQLGQFLSSEIVVRIKTLFDRSHSVLPKNFNDYNELMACQDAIGKLLDEILTKCSEGNDDGDNNLDHIIESLNELRVIASSGFYKLQLKFMENALVEAHSQNSMLFGDIVLTEENLKKRYRGLCKLFHPDKATWIFEKHKPILLQFFNLIVETYSASLEKLQREYSKSTEFNFYEKIANECWEIALDYRHALKGEWGKLEHLTKDVLLHLTEQELKSRRLEYLNLAYEQYRACCKIADKNKDLSKQIKLRGYLALCKYSSGESLEAQLYALSGLRLVFDHSQRSTQEELLKAKQIFEKVKGLNLEIPQTSRSEPNQRTSTGPVSQALVRVENAELSPSVRLTSGYSFSDRQNMSSSIEQELREIGSQLMVSADGTMVRYTTSEEEILRSRRRGTAHQVVGRTVQVTAVAGGLTVAGVAVVEVLQGVGLVAGAALGGPIFAILGGITAIGLGCWAGYKLIKEGNRILEEPEIREKLNSIMLRALQFHKDRDFSGFILALSEEYQTGVSLLSLRSPEDVIVPAAIIETLRKHGFRPDGIAYLLNLIGESFCSGKLSIPGIVSSSDLRERSKQVFYGVLSEKLVAEADKLDKRVSELRKKGLTHLMQQRARWFQDFVFLSDTNSIASEHLKDAQTMTFKARLEEMRNMARMNIAIIRIVDGGGQEFEFAKGLVHEVRDSMNLYCQFFSSGKSRLEVLEDFLWVISGQPDDEPLLLLAKSPDGLSHLHEQQPSENYLNYLRDCLGKASSEVERVKIYNKRGSYYEQLALDNERSNKIASLRDWQEAQKSYLESLHLAPLNMNAGLGFARSLLNLAYYHQTLQFLEKNGHLSGIPEYWIIATVAHRKRNHYDKAEACVVEALSRDPKNLVAAKERTLLQRLKSYAVLSNPSIYQVPLVSDEAYFGHHRSEEKPFYKILSIDGGGVRGLMPAFWLSEIERSIRKPISHLFNMITGTSTGAIIGAGLAAPFLETQTEFVLVPTDHGLHQVPVQVKVPSPYRPQYSAFDIVQLYRERSPHIFTPHESGFFSSLINTRPLNSKYTADGRLSLFGEYFQGQMLSKTLVDFVVPAANENNLTSTHLFSTKRANLHQERDDKLVDVLMATTAAPTFFPSHSIRGRGIFSDGGIHANNPAQMAYCEATQAGVDSERIFMLSLGTGSCMPDPLNPDACRGLLFWAYNLHRVVLPVQEGNVDNQMYASLGNRYQRWQTWLESPIALDDHSDDTLETLLEMGRQYIEELHNSEENRLGKLFELLESDVDNFPKQESARSRSFVPGYEAERTEDVRTRGQTPERNAQNPAMLRFAQRRL